MTSEQNDCGSVYVPVCGVVIDHGVHVPGGAAERQLRLSEGRAPFGGVPIGLGEKGNAKTIGFENTSEQSGCETRMIDVCVAPKKAALPKTTSTESQPRSTISGRVRGRDPNMTPL